MKKKKYDEKDKYRKKRYTPPIKKTVPKQEALNLLKENNNIMWSIFCLKNNQLTNFFKDARDKGVDLKILYKAVHYFGGPNSKILESTDEIKALVKKFNSWTTVMKNAVTVLCEHLDPIPFESEFNKKLSTAQTRFKKIIEEYFERRLQGPFKFDPSNHSGNFMMPAWQVLEFQFKPLTQKSYAWNEIIVSLVDEFCRRGYSDNQAYKETAELLNIAYPTIYKDTDHDLVRQRYKYHKKKNKGKAEVIEVTCEQDKEELRAELDAF